MKPKRTAPGDVVVHDAGVYFRCKRELKNAFDTACHEQGYLAPTVYRAMMQKFIDNWKARQ